MPKTKVTQKEVFHSATHMMEQYVESMLKPENGIPAIELMQENFNAQVLVEMTLLMVITGLNTADIIDDANS